MVKHKNKTEQRTRGAPQKNDADKVAGNGLTKDINERLAQLSEERGVSIALIKREAITWYLDAIEKTEEGDRSTVKTS